MRKATSLEKNKEREDSLSKSGQKTGVTPRPNATLVLLEGDYSGRDEMNLAGNPFALLQSSGRSGQTHIRYEWERRLPTGRLVIASWEVNGHERLGLPGPTEEKLYLVLLQITRESGTTEDPWPRKVPFSCGDVLKRMGWSDNAASYRELRDSFARLQSVSIQADHTFWDTRSKSFYKAVGLGILGEFAIAAEPRGRKGQGTLPLSWFEWEGTLHSSISGGNVRNLALDFTLSLEVPTALRLFRYLDMMRHSAKPPLMTFTIGVMKLRDRLGMIGYKHTSKVKERLERAHQELIERGYLESVEYLKGKDGVEMVLYRFGLVKVTAALDSASQVTKPTTKAVALATQVPFVEEERLFPQVAHTVFIALSQADQERLRQMARQEVEPAFWDRLERPDSPMALVLWELVAREFPDEYARHCD